MLEKFFYEDKLYRRKYTAVLMNVTTSYSYPFPWFVSNSRHGLNNSEFLKKQKDEFEGHRTKSIIPDPLQSHQT